jgi:hypothetical protein
LGRYDQSNALVMTVCGLDNLNVEDGPPGANHLAQDFTPLGPSSYVSFRVPHEFTEDASEAGVIGQALFHPQPTPQGQGNRTISDTIGITIVPIEATPPLSGIVGAAPGSVMSAEGRNRRDGEDASPRQASSNQIDWDYWGNTIHDLYLVENHTAEEVCFEMWAIYGVQIG